MKNFAKATYIFVEKRPNRTLRSILIFSFDVLIPLWFPMKWKGKNFPLKLIPKQTWGDKMFLMSFCGGVALQAIIVLVEGVYYRQS